ncbi:4-(cytidine 5'-diphospho)-2-C-methyl-D-erythritol kinase [Marichromatium bheemlicum]|uniref:4-diphosphocytidyl-2-C-methyl-D-erythritol kinase n=1 Tax=Marichromatium bheemlicum TaxID=365339 RepID=A0ABX1I4P2_9GAMM|nr:4-(cytidine 5'-diphospho)-2-C-methyl-D-erythritol kinase [Marichromatium bheemlicum]NKN32178.1 4-(cytidine 5'-diphospho)-2-C-methyl-D-erythritol kinase [Marichromatium bheemlicum]
MIDAALTDNDAWTAWPAPAKLNLMLRVVGRRADGYHELQTVFQFVDRCDRLHLRVRDDGAVCRAGELPGVAAEADLTVRAARALQMASDCRLGVDIRCEKVLPMGGGLGGGSSDAATTLVALNALWGTGFDTEALARLALPLGADVPVFVRGQAAWGEGVGERLSPVELPEPWFLVLAPPCSVSTQAVFTHPRLTRDSKPITLANFLDGDVVNDCLPVVRDEYPAVADALEWLSRWGEARLTGTGACVFAAFAERDQALAAWEQRPAGIDGFVARGCNRSPLLDRLDDFSGQVERV